MKEADVLRCQIHDWYPRFRHASTKTRLVELPQEFITFLQQDGLFLPRSSDAMPGRTTVTDHGLQAEDYNHWEEEEGEQDEPEVPSFPALEQEVASCIQALGGAVFPKLNWSSPTDAAWISTTGSLKCSNFGEISLLLKASDNIVHDLKHAFDACEDRSRDRPGTFFLALRKWYDLRPDMEFRGFVRGGLLVGVCQREVTGFYPSLLSDKRELERAVVDFFEDTLSGKFGADDYTFDCYVLKDFRVKLLDFNPWGGSTLPLLFSWDELEGNYEQAQSSSQQRIDFRIVTSEGLVQPGVRSCTGVPFDFVETGAGSAWDSFLRQAEAEIRQQTTGSGG